MRYGPVAIALVMFVSAGSISCRSRRQANSEAEAPSGKDLLTINGIEIYAKYWDQAKQHLQGKAAKKLNCPPDQITWTLKRKGGRAATEIDVSGCGAQASYYRHSPYSPWHIRAEDPDAPVPTTPSDSTAPKPQSPIVEEKLIVDGVEVYATRWHQTKLQLTARAGKKFSCPDDQLAFTLLAKAGRDPSEVRVVGCGKDEIYRRADGDKPWVVVKD